MGRGRNKVGIKLGRVRPRDQRTLKCLGGSSWRVGFTSSSFLAPVASFPVEYHCPLVDYTKPSWLQAAASSPPSSPALTDLLTPGSCSAAPITGAAARAAQEAVLLCVCQRLPTSVCVVPMPPTHECLCSACATHPGHLPQRVCTAA